MSRALLHATGRVPVGLPAAQSDGQDRQHPQHTAQLDEPDMKPVS